MESSEINFKKYSYMKSTSFNLEIESKESFNYNEDLDVEFNFDTFIKKGRKILEIKNFMFLKNKDGTFKKKNENYILSKTIKINKRWSKIYSNYKTYNKKAGNIGEEIIEVIQLFEEKINYLENLHNQKININRKSSRKSEFSYIISEIYSKNLFFFIRDLINFGLVNKNFFFNYEKEVREFEEYLDLAKKTFLSPNSRGIEIAKGSFNYYTINKRSKIYFDDVISKLNLKFNEKFTFYETKDGLHKLKIQIKNEIEIEKKEFTLEKNDYNVLEILKKEEKFNFPLNLEQTYRFMKLFKAKLKSQLFEDCKSIDISKIRNYSFLFNDSDKLKKVRDLTIKIEKYNKNQDIKKIKICKNERGKYFYLSKNNKLVFEDWKKFNQFYKRIAVLFGNIKTKIRNYEREQFESQKLNYWCLLLEEKGGYYVLFVPKEKRRDFRTLLLDKNIISDSIENNNVFMFNSLTKRALDKLCFSEEGSFFQEMPIDLQNEIKNFKKSKVEERDKLSLSLFKNILNSNYVKEVVDAVDKIRRLDLEDFDIEKVLQATTLNEFEKNLERECYKVISFNVPKDKFDDFINKMGIIKCKITSYDIEKRNEDIFQTPKSKVKKHTEFLWNEFLENPQGFVRLNPEVKVNFRSKDIEVERFLIDKRNINLNSFINRKGSYNRYLRDSYIVTFSFLLNAGEKYPLLAYKKSEELLSSIQEFNKGLNSEFKKTNFYLYGIDIGEAELASLNVVNFSIENSYEFNGKKILKPNFPNNSEIKCFKLRKEKYNCFEKPSEKMVNFTEIYKKNVISNISYFIDRIDDNDWFEKRTFENLDLTCAKLINEVIIENGDVLTYLKYIKKVAKRKIFDLCFNNNFKLNNFVLEWGKENEKNTLFLNSEKIYSFKYKYDGLKYFNKFEEEIIYTHDNIKNYFEKYIKSFNNPENIKIPQLNDLRDALVSNMIGVIFYLQKFYPGYVVLENMPDKNHEDKYIIKRLELAFYKRFQTLGLVPPHVKNLMEVRKLIENENNNFMIEKIKNLNPDNQDRNLNELSKFIQNNNYEGFKNKIEEIVKQDRYSKNIEIKNLDKEIDKLKFVQIGLVGFVNESGTSKLCPYCENIVKNNKKTEGHFKCNICNFSTENCNNSANNQDILDSLKLITNCDNLASFNIAKYFYKNINRNNGK